MASSLEQLLARVRGLPPDIDYRDQQIRALEDELLLSVRERFGPDSELLGRYQILRAQFDYGRSPDDIQGMFGVFLRDLGELLERAVEREVMFVNDEGWREGFDAERLDDGTYRVVSMPVSGRGFAIGDVIEVGPDEGGTTPRFKKVRARSGMKIVRFYYFRGWDAPAQSFVKKIEALGCTWEHSLGCVVMIYVPKGVSFRVLKPLMAELGVEDYEYAHRAGMATAR